MMEERFARQFIAVQIWFSTVPFISLKRRYVFSRDAGKPGADVTIKTINAL